MSHFFHVLEVPHMSDENPVTQHASVSQVEQECLGCRRIQSQSNPVGLHCFEAPLANCMCAVGSCAPRTVPLSVAGCDLYERQFVLQTRIWPKYNFKGDAPPSASSAGHIFAEREAFIFVCLLCGSQFAGFRHFFFF